MPDKIPSWGYRPGEGKIFELDPGEKLPAGWVDHPVPDVAETDAPVEHADHDHDIEVLREKAAALGIDVDGRWGAKKLEKLIAALMDSRWGGDEHGT